MGFPAMTVRGVASYLNVDEKTIYRLAKRGELPGFKVAGTWRFKKNDIDQWIEILEHHGDSPWNVVLQELLALTKMNWNTADFCCQEPVTIAFSRRVGHILAELPPDGLVRPEYRFYM